MSSEVAEVTSAGRAFQTRAPATEKAQLCFEIVTVAIELTLLQTPDERTLCAFVESHPDKCAEVIQFMKDSLSPLVDKLVQRHGSFLKYFDILCRS